MNAIDPTQTQRMNIELLDCVSPYDCLVQLQTAPSYFTTQPIFSIQDAYRDLVQFDIPPLISV